MAAGSPPFPPARWRRWTRRLAAIALGALAGLILLEAGMWGLHFLYRPAPIDVSELAPRTGERRIVCFGDSNTYGVHLDARASYPGRLQILLDRAAGQPWRVVNLGYPGQNTAQIRARLAQNLAAYRPEIVIVWAGVNNTWSPAWRHLWRQPDSESEPHTLDALIQESRVYSTLRMVASRLRGGQLPGLPGGVPGVGGASRGEGLGESVIANPQPWDMVRFTNEEVQQGIAIDLRRIDALCREHGAALVVADYPWEVASVEELVNPVIQAFARESGVPLVPLYDAVRPEIDELGPRGRFLDFHATALSNYAVAGRVLATLIEAELLEPCPQWLEPPSLRELAAGTRVELLGKTPDLLECEVFGTPGSRIRLKARPLWKFRDDEEPMLAVKRGGTLPADLLGNANADARLNPEGYELVSIELPADLAALRAAGPAGASLWGWRVSTVVKGPGAEDAPEKLPALEVPESAEALAAAEPAAE